MKFSLRIMNRKILAFIIIFIFGLMTTLACSRQIGGPYPNRIKFVLTGNTHPASPFIGFTKKLPKLIQFINKDNPALTIHTGNNVHGGNDWMGVNNNDLVRQFKIYDTKISQLSSPLFVTIGEKDLFNQSQALFKKFTKRDVVYSINYGTVHFAFVGLIRTKSKSIKQQIEWLKKDLRKNHESKAIFIVTHMPVFTKHWPKLSNKNAALFHKTIKNHQVKAVFSGNHKRYSKKIVDSINYITVGCGGFTKEEHYRSYYQYYIVNYDGLSITIDRKKLK